ncbi:E3 SUMO-protein ligase SIZ1 [Apostasia shenzhenica]|uniref:E3 SUMO-protein ligase SIZ1 n=1 Tax=Apostasia shenzhenica TaxID=1088818 RepID=A0A2I0A8N1_9ASPA|nr:E3 SUMO-protein ligase SIZ1 [Apostasia shenzhenica]
MVEIRPSDISLLDLHRPLGKDLLARFVPVLWSIEAQAAANLILGSMDLVSSCKDKLAYFRIKELKDVLSQLGLAKQGKKQDLMDRVLSLLSDEPAPTHGLAKKMSIGKDRVAKVVEDTYRKMQVAGANDLASKNHGISDVKNANPREERDDSNHLEMKVRCLCGSSLITESMIQCDDRRCQVWQHVSCVLIPEKPLDGIMPEIPQIFYCELCRLSRADPFWLTIAHPLLPLKLLSSGAAPDGTNPLQTLDKMYPLSRADRELLQRSDYDLQVWCILLNDKVAFRMQWPQYPDLQVNGVQIRTINRAASQLLGINGRDDGPIITTCSREGTNKVCLTWCDARVFCFGVRIVRRRTLQQVLNLVPKEGDGECFEDALARVRRCIGGSATENADSDSDLEVVADTISVNLRCPMSGSRMKVAGRFRPCIHMGCFDLETFVELNQRSRKWQCPICLKNYSLDDLIIDPYFNRIASLMQNCGEDVNEIDVKPDGSWRAKISGEFKDLLMWHLPDGTICAVKEMNVNAKPKLDISNQVKQEVISEGYPGLKLGIKKNNNGDWVLNKSEPVEHESFGISSFEKSGNFFHNIIPTSSSATGSYRDGEDPSVNQDGGANFDLPFGNELESISIDLYKTGDECPPPPSADLNVIVLSDSDEDNVAMLSPPTAHDTIPSDCNVVPADQRVTDSYPDLYETSDHFEMPLWPLQSCPQNGSDLKLFGADPDGSDAFAGLGQNEYNLRSNSLVDDCRLHDLPSCLNADSNGNLINNETLTYDCNDPTLQIFLPSQPATSVHSQTDLNSHTEMGNVIGSDDWISLSIGGVGEPHLNSISANEQSSEQHFAPEESRMESLATASLLISMSGQTTNRTNLNSFNGENNFSFSHPRQPRSARKRPFHSINLDSDTD